MKENGTLQVLYDGKVVGKLALMAGRKIAFEYSEELLAVGLQAGLEKSWCEEVIEKMKNTVEERLEKYLQK